ncbi:putative Transcriptional regulatory protein RcsB [Cupriavidus taiwanensis]|uniref:Transcriptional regulatory protein RcsB n=1 Tax=Cupriavidus taiwanensis TaxID=164546 RepID=A0A375E7L9_9BURK|nr:response regulator transcription factor [Cupriavidus taiwanensis]SOZ64452.1 putative Transcriptional regulatory protein RcsB [Cupriavidus taiwanensis]SOZ65156.1 putative Transcriptional regulatory protein RcsB [Cupriavidus taiwanensis]SOZ68813.1 putative Transcriptional regulatory protein RcsB [Cupriavidus taiwanensis]SPA08246.1 putative Transcriptional regulatory protein RcsB [Cupriavidus taiwanensis]
MKILLADDHPLILYAVEAALANVPGLDLCGSARTPAALLSLLDHTACDVVVADYSMPQQPGDGWQLYTAILNRHPDTRLVAYTSFPEPLLVAGLVRLGVHAIVSKAEPVTELVRAIEAVAAGARHLSPGAQAALDLAMTTPQYQRLARLSQRELLVLGLFAAGLSVSQSAALTGRSVKTISTQKAAIKKKIAARSDGELYLNAVRQGLLMRVPQR